MRKKGKEEDGDFGGFGDEDGLGRGVFFFGVMGRWSGRKEKKRGKSVNADFSALKEK